MTKITDTLYRYRTGELNREQMLHWMQQFPWKRPPVHVPPRADEHAWENDEWPTPGTSEEIMSAAARGDISRDDRNAILDVIRATAGQPHRRS